MAVTTGDLITAAMWNAIGDSVAVTEVLSPVYKTDTFTESVAAAGESGDVTGLTFTVTPSDVAEGFVLDAFLNVGHPIAGQVSATLYRSIDGGAATPVLVGDVAGDRRRVTAPGSVRAATEQGNIAVVGVVDFPATTAVVVYSFRLSHVDTSTRNVHVNRADTDDDVNRRHRSASAFRAMRCRPAAA